LTLLSRADSPKALRALDAGELPALCEALRGEIIRVCGKVGGHLGASLGTVELTVALHRVFKSPVDRLVWDVGHQAYAHKLLTGRRERMETLRQAGGVAPFLDPTESEHDAFGAGHACTAISVALGILEAKRALGQPGQAVAIVGDGALTGGLSFEGLNNAGHSAMPLKIVVNDNGMSISANVGAVPAMLRDGARAFFETMGFVFLGPVDGHELVKLETALRALSACGKPAVVQVMTQKGHGFSHAESDVQTRGHAMGPYELRDGKLVRSRHGQATFSDAWAATLERRMEVDPRVVVVTPAMLEGSSLTGLQTRFPDRVYDVGIAEQHAVTFAAGLAHAGLRPVVCIYSTFLQRAYDQVIHDVALPNLPVIIAIDRAGLVGADGATHQGIFDLTFLRTVPQLELVAATFGEDLEGLLASALERGGPVAIRFPRGTLPLKPGGLAEVQGRGARWLKRVPQPELTFIGAGPLVLAALTAAEQSEHWAVVDARYVAPLDEAMVREAAASGAIVTVEEGSERGGLGAAVLETLAKLGLTPKVKVMGLPVEAFVRHGDARVQRAELGLDAAGLKRAALEVLAR